MHPPTHAVRHAPPPHTQACSPLTHPFVCVRACVSLQANLREVNIMNLAGAKLISSQADSNQVATGLQVGGSSQVATALPSAS